MPNRIIKESICSSDSIDQLKPFDETFFYRLIVNCDDYGRMDAREKILKSRLFPLKENLTLKNVAESLRALANAGLVVLYEVDGKPFLHLPTWEFHQQVRAQRSKYPAPDEGCNRMISDDIRCPRNPIQSESNPTNAQAHGVIADRFALFWEAYPRKRSKGAAEKAWSKLKPDDELFQRIMKSLEMATTSPDWTKDNGQYIPYAQKWLNTKGWEDEYESPNESSEKPDLGWSHNIREATT